MQVCRHPLFPYSLPRRHACRANLTLGPCLRNALFHTASQYLNEVPTPLQRAGCIAQYGRGSEPTHTQHRAGPGPCEQLLEALSLQVTSKLFAVSIQLGAKQLLAGESCQHVGIASISVALVHAAIHI